MKTELTKKESHHLIDLGVPKEKASGFEYVGELEYDVCDNYFDNPINEKAPIFKLDDFLNGEILPKEILVKGEVADLCFDWNSQIKRWCAAYAWWSEEYESNEEELIDALYKLACWYYSKIKK